MRLRRLSKTMVILVGFGVIMLVAVMVLLATQGADGPGLRADDVAPQAGPPAQATTAYEHLEQFQALAEEHGDRAAGTPGYEAAAQYIEQELEDAGYQTTRQYFTVETRDEEEIETFSILAETAGGDADNVIMLGAHLDGVPGSPGINDNASGVAALLETARRLNQQDTVANKVRFAWWGAEEYRGFPGSSHYVEELEDHEELDTIAAYLNFDMVASPNHVIALYNAHDTDSRLDVPEGSEALMEVFTDYFDSRGQPWIPTHWDFASDQIAFAEADIPVGGLFTGSNERKSAPEARLFGGEARQPRDPNYHQPGDDLGNVDRQTLDLTTDAITHIATALARNPNPLEAMVPTTSPTPTSEAHPAPPAEHHDEQTDGGPLGRGPG